MGGGLRLSQYCMCVVFHVSHTFQSFFPKTAASKNEHHSVTGQNKQSQQDSGFFSPSPKFIVTTRVVLHKC